MATILGDIFWIAIATISGNIVWMTMATKEMGKQNVDGNGYKRNGQVFCGWQWLQTNIYFSQFTRKGTMGKNAVEQIKHSADKPTLLGRLTDKLVDRLDIHKLSDSVADQLCEKIASKFKTSDLVDRLLDNYHERIQAAITEAIFQRLFPMS